METVVSFNSSAEQSVRYLTWTPIPAQVGFRDPGGATAPVAVRLRNRQSAQGGKVLFYPSAPSPSDVGVDELSLSLPEDGTVVEFFVSGKFGSPSSEDKDAAIEVIDVATGALLSETPLMVRVRKNANQLSDSERNRFLEAIAELNAEPDGFPAIRAMHQGFGLTMAHFGVQFLPWHRAFLLDVERRLQVKDSAVTIPYWKFDEPAPRLFTSAFLGVADAVARVQFPPGHLLENWTTEGNIPGIIRETWVQLATERATSIGAAQGADLDLTGLGVLARARDDAETLSAFPTPNNAFAELAPTPAGPRWMGLFNLEGREHAVAHNSVRTGFLRILRYATRDPLFFLLHANVDRLWALWQRMNGGRFDVNDPRTYPTAAPPSSSATVGVNFPGQQLNETMWPWDQTPRQFLTVTGQPFVLLDTPGTGMPPSPIVSAPGNAPRVRDMFDFQGMLIPASRLGFDYDTVPYGQP